MNRGGRCSCGSSRILPCKYTKISFYFCLFVMLVVISYWIQNQQAFSIDILMPHLKLQEYSSIRLESRSENQEPAFIRAEANTMLYNETSMLISSSFNDQNLSAAPWTDQRKPTDHLSAPIHLPQDDRVAICLVGGARAFELTGPTITKYILDVYDGADVFLHTPFDQNSYKFHLLKARRSNLVSIRIFRPRKLPETWMRRKLLSSLGSPNGIQGLLQYFNLVEGCWNMITDYEKKQNFTYKWIIRTRVDGYWNRPLPNISYVGKDHRYMVPYGSQFGGLNDRLGMGNHETSRVALQRLSILPRLYNLGYRGLNSESLFKAQLNNASIKVKFKRFCFCILSFRKYDFPTGRWNTPVASISSEGPLNGAKCRPCNSKIVGHLAKHIVDNLQRSWSWSGPTYGLKLCDARGDWEQDWEDVYDMAAGSEFASIRKAFMEQSMSDCIHQVELFHQQWEIWDAPSPYVICQENFRSVPSLIAPTPFLPRPSNSI